MTMNDGSIGQLYALRARSKLVLVLSVHDRLLHEGHFDHEGHCTNILHFELETELSSCCPCIVFTEHIVRSGAYIVLLVAKKVSLSHPQSSSPDDMDENNTYPTNNSRKNVSVLALQRPLNYSMISDKSLYSSSMVAGITKRFRDFLAAFFFGLLRCDFLADFLATAFFAADFFEGAFLAAAFLTGAFFAGAFLARALSSSSCTHNNKLRRFYGLKP